MQSKSKIMLPLPVSAYSEAVQDKPAKQKYLLEIPLKFWKPVQSKSADEDLTSAELPCADRLPDYNQNFQEAFYFLTS